MVISIIGNPAAGRGRTKKFFREFCSRTAMVRADVRALWTERPGHARELAAEAAKNSAVVCAIGGDGTAHEVANGIFGSGVPMIVVPSGSGNDFASMFGSPQTPEELDRVIRDGYGCRVDVIDIGGAIAVNNVGIGFEALVNLHSHRIRHLRGLPLYLTAVFRALRNFDCPRLEMSLAESAPVARRRLMLSVGNGVRSGGGFYLTPDAVPDDGHMDICGVDAMGRRRILTLLPRAIRGGHVAKPGVDMHRTRRLDVRGDRPFHVHVDGEYHGQHEHMTLQIIERALSVLCLRDRPTRAMHPPEKILVADVS